MYGMVNKELKNSITKEFGDDVWRKVEAKANPGVEYFVEMSAYPDHITYDLVDAVCEITGVTADDFLHQFGEDWILQTYNGTYRHYYESVSTLPDMIEHLNDMHADLGLVLPELTSPSFHVIDKSRGHCVVDYVSERPGLTSFVSGLFKGLGKVYQTQITVKLIETPEEVTQRYRIEYS
mgnify:CR=1 FL=1